MLGLPVADERVPRELLSCLGDGGLGGAEPRDAAALLALGLYADGGGGGDG